MTRFVLFYLLIFAVNLAIHAHSGDGVSLALALVSGVAALANYRGPVE